MFYKTVLIVLLKSQVIKYYQGRNFKKIVMSILNSTYKSFSFTSFGSYEQLITLRQERLPNQMYKIIEDLNENQPRVVDDISEIFNSPLTKIDQIEEDDFSEEFDSHALKTCIGLTTFTELFVSLPLFYFLILFDKYGEDAMKRSLYNYLSSQIAYPVIVLIIFNRPFEVWRVFVGPLKSIVADFHVFAQNSAIIWAILCQTEGFLTRALFVTNYKRISGINDKFFSSFLFFVNIGFSFGSHILLFFFRRLGSDELMIGVEKPKYEIQAPLSTFYVITIGVTSVIFVGSLLIIAVNKFLAFQKDKNLVKKINITLDNDYGEQTIVRFNTSRYNKPIFNTILAFTNTFLLSGGAIYYITSFHNEGSHSEYIQRFWFIWGTKLIIMTIIPILMVAFFLKDFRTFIVTRSKVLRS